jgi:hypothetical protein
MILMAHRRNKIFAVLLGCTISLTTNATTRSPAARAEFQRMHPCPVNAARRGPCPGYQIDHIKPLKCGGPDRYTNMQWLTVEQHKAKTKREAAWCR